MDSLKGTITIKMEYTEDGVISTNTLEGAISSDICIMALIDAMKNIVSIEDEMKDDLMYLISHIKDKAMKGLALIDDKYSCNTKDEML